MLELKNIKKDYITGTTVTNALKGIDLSFRRNEFVSILGPSGCGKTTLLNIIGGLDRYTSGDLVIKGTSTKRFTDRDWDTYRNHSIGFVFQSYNLISHLSLLGNVELALTIGGISRKERTTRALEALKKVGLGDIAKKKPNQLSGGQCQRVAIARALVNNPEILLADEPTGALDSETSVQIMELLKEVASDRLVIMVTHNPDLARQYSSRIISMKDGLTVDDTMPYSSEEAAKEVVEYKVTDEETKKNKKKAKMSLPTSFSLSGRNLLAKAKRTSLVVVASSIGIIGISAVLGVSYGVKAYIRNMQDDMLSGNPVEISETALDLSSMINASTKSAQSQAVINGVIDGKVNIKYMIEYLATQQSNLKQYAIKNDITYDYVRYVESMPREYYSALKEEFGINPKLNIFRDASFMEGYNLSPEDPNYANNIDVKDVSLMQVEAAYTQIINKTEFAEFASMISLFTDTFDSMPNSPEYIESQYDILNEGGKVATEEDEIMLVVSKNTELTDIFLGQIGYITQQEFVDIIDRYADHKEEIKPIERVDYDKLLNTQFTYYPNDSLYVENTNVYTKSISPYLYQGQIKNGETLANGKPLKVTAILRAKENVSYGCLESGFIVSPAFEQMCIRDSINSAITQSLLAQEARYEAMTAAEKENYKYMSMYTYDYSYRGEVTKNNVSSAVSIVNLGEDSGSSTNPFSSVIAAMVGDQYSVSSQIKTAVRKVGGNSLTNKIAIYPNSFDEKHLVTDYLDKWNEDVDITVDGIILTPDSRNDVTYADNLEVIISLINTMIEIVTIALICFTSLSLVVSTVMIGIITYVSVVERIKEIGIIRSLGGRKLDVANLFNVETFIIGGLSGLFGLTVTYGLCGIVNIIINQFAKVGTLMILPWNYALLVLSVAILLTIIAGLIPASAASRKDPVVALRTSD